MSSKKNDRDRGNALRFTHVRLENWRNFVRADVDLQRRVFLVGPNASGKSNFLDVFRFLHDIVSVGGGFEEAVRKRGGVSSLRCLAARRYTNVAVRVQLGNETMPNVWEYEIHFSQDKLRRPLIRKERVVKEGQEIMVRPNEADNLDPERLTQTYLQQINVNRDFRNIVDCLASVRYLHIVPQLVREPERSVGRKQDPFGGDFLERIATTPENTQKARLRRIQNALRVAVPQLSEVELKRDVRGTPHLRGKYEHWRPQGAWQNEVQFSDGTLRLMGLLWVMLDGSGPLLLEEPELSLHPEVTRFIPQMFARVQRRSGRQVLLSTHSAELLRDDGIGLDEVLLLVPATEGTKVQATHKIKEAKMLLEKGMSLADVVIPNTRPEQAEQLTLFGDS